MQFQCPIVPKICIGPKNVSGLFDSNFFSIGQHKIIVSETKSVTRSSSVYMLSTNKLNCMCFTEMDGDGGHDRYYNENNIIPARAHRVNRLPPQRLVPDYFAVPPQSEVYVQMPGDRVYSGILQPLEQREPPSWAEEPYQPHIGLENLYLVMPDGNKLTAVLRFFRDHHDNSVDRYRCFIKLPNNTILVAHLHTDRNNAHLINERTRVYVKMPENNDIIYMAQVRNGDHYRPAWLQ